MVEAEPDHGDEMRLRSTSPVPRSVLDRQPHHRARPRVEGVVHVGETRARTPGQQRGPAGDRDRRRVRVQDPVDEPVRPPSVALAAVRPWTEPGVRPRAEPAGRHGQSCALGPDAARGRPVTRDRLDREDEGHRRAAGNRRGGVRGEASRRGKGCQDHGREPGREATDARTLDGRNPLGPPARDGWQLRATVG